MTVSFTKVIALLIAVITCTALTLLLVVAPPASAAPTPSPAPGAGAIQFSAADYATDESAGTVTLELQRVGGSVGEITATIQTHDGTATIVDDYAGIPTPLTLTWSNGNVTPKTVTLPIKPDTIDEGDETFTMDIVSDHAGTPSTATVTIVGTSPGTIQFSQPMFLVNEDAGVVEVQVERAGGTVGAASAFVATNAGTATAGDDYTEIPVAAAVELNWADGDDSTKTVAIVIADDGIDEVDENFHVDILTVSGASLGTPSSATVTIADPVVPAPPAPPATPGPTPADPASPTPTPTPTPVPVVRPAGVIEFAAPGYVVAESQCTVAVELQRVEGKHGAVTVLVGTNSGDATAGDDYEPITAFNPVEVTWADGDTSSKVVLVKLIADSQPELDESFTVLLLRTEGAGQGVDTTNVVITEKPIAGTTPKTASGCGDASTGQEVDGPEPAARNRAAKTSGRQLTSETRGEPAPASSAGSPVGMLAVALAAAGIAGTWGTRRFVLR